MKYKFFGLVCILAFFVIWAWQLGLLAISDAPPLLRSWSNPGIMALPTIGSIAFFIAANYFLTKKQKYRGVSL